MSPHNATKLWLQNSELFTLDCAKLEFEDAMLLKTMDLPKK